MSKPDPILAKMREICLELPDTKETLTWGHPHFRVGEKIFSGYGTGHGEHAGRATIGFKLEMDHADALVMNDDRFTRAPYVGHHGWVSMDASRVKDWNEVASLVFESYRLIAPKRSLARVAGVPALAKSKAAPKKRVQRAAPVKATSKAKPKAKAKV